jgi:hypothetical protein
VVPFPHALRPRLEIPRRPRPHRRIRGAYGAGGDWTRLFRQGDGYLGTELLHPAQPGGLYLTIDRWRRESDWNDFLAAHGAAYRALDAKLAALCAEDSEIGDFNVP